MEHSLKVISWNITRKCNLLCNHCYLPANTDDLKKVNRSIETSTELSTEQAFQVIDQIGDVNPEVMLILSGGEPLLRDDIFELVSHASRRGMMVVLGTNGVLMNNEVAGRLKQSGASGVSISLDSAKPEIHDWIRLVPGAWERAVKAVEICRANEFSVQINTVVTRSNYDEVPDIIQFARSLGAHVYSPFFLVCTGRGEELTDITPVQYENIMSWIANMERERNGMMIRTRCAPTFRRILYQSNPESSLLKLDTGKCMAGTNYCRITPEGAVTPCPYIPQSVGNMKRGGFPDIWEKAGVFASLRRPSLQGKCSTCEFRLLCGGCRARAYAAYDDMMKEDPWCIYSPKGGDAITPPVFSTVRSLLDTDDVSTLLWTDKAEKRLKRVPFFVRSMVRSAVERYAVEKHYREITPEVMIEARENFSMDNMSRH